MKCPKCSANAPEGAAECPGCGIIFAKLAKLREKESAEVRAAAALLATAPPQATAPSTGPRNVAFAIVFAWMVVLAYALHVSIRRSKPPKDMSIIDDGATRHVLMRDPATGDMRKVPIREARSSKPSAKKDD